MSRVDPDVGPLWLDLGRFRRVLCVAPHPDDETLGCAGTIAVARANLAAVTVVLLTDGEDDPTGRPLLLLPAARRAFKADLVERRRREYAAAMAELGGVDTVRFSAPDGRVAREGGRLVARIAELVAGFKPDLILAPAAGDGHRDHRAAARILIEALGAGAAANSVLVLGYEVWSDLAPTHLANATPAAGAKRRALDRYSSRFARVRLDERVIARNRAHAARYLGRDGCVEAFRAFPLAVRDA